jgi:hypothetical protein
MENLGSYGLWFKCPLISGIIDILLINLINKIINLSI